MIVRIFLWFWEPSWRGSEARRHFRMRTLRVRITTRSARHDHCPFSKWVRAKVSISAQNKTSDEVNERGEAAREKEKGEIRRRSATKWLGEDTEKWAALSLVSYRMIFINLFNGKKL